MPTILKSCVFVALVAKIVFGENVSCEVQSNVDVRKEDCDNCVNPTNPITKNYNPCQQPWLCKCTYTEYKKNKYECSLVPGKEDSGVTTESCGQCEYYGDEMKEWPCPLSVGDDSRPCQCKYQKAATASGETCEVVENTVSVTQEDCDKCVDPDLFYVRDNWPCQQPWLCLCSYHASLKNEFECHLMPGRELDGVLDSACKQCEYTGIDTHLWPCPVSQTDYDKTCVCKTAEQSWVEIFGPIFA